MKRTLLIIATCLLALSTILPSCSKGLTPSQAASGKVKCGRYLN